MRQASQRNSGRHTGARERIRLDVARRKTQVDAAQSRAARTRAKPSAARVLKKTREELAKAREELKLERTAKKELKRTAKALVVQLERRAQELSELGGAYLLVREQLARVELEAEATRQAAETARTAEEELARARASRLDYEEKIRALEAQLLGSRERIKPSVRGPRQTDELIAVHAPQEVKTVTVKLLAREIINRFHKKVTITFDLEGKTYEQEVDVLDLPLEKIHDFFLEKTNKFLGEKRVESLTASERRRLREFEAVLLNALLQCDSEFKSRERFITTFYTACYLILRQIHRSDGGANEVDFVLNEVTNILSQAKLSDAERAIARESVTFEAEQKAMTTVIDALAPLIKEFEAREDYIIQLKEKFEEKRFGLFRANKTLTECLTLKEVTKMHLWKQYLRTAAGVVSVVVLSYFGLRALTPKPVNEIPKDERAAYDCYIDNLKEPQAAAVEDAVSRSTTGMSIESIREEFKLSGGMFNEYTIVRAFQLFDYVQSKEIITDNLTSPQWIEFTSTDGKKVRLACPLSPTTVLAIRAAECRDYAELLAGMIKTMGLNFRFKFYYEPENEGGLQVGHVHLQVPFRFNGSLEQAKARISKLLREKYKGRGMPLVVNGVELGEAPSVFWVTLDPREQHPARYDPVPDMPFHMLLTPNLEDLTRARGDGG